MQHQQIRNLLVLEAKPTALGLTPVVTALCMASNAQIRRTYLIEARKQRKEAASLTDSRQRSAVVVKQALEAKESALHASEDLCNGCWLRKRFCICESLLFVPCLHHIEVVLHQKEYLRASNTGRIINQCVQNAHMSVLHSGDASIQLQTTDTTPSNMPACVLFPSVASISAEEWFSSLNAEERRSGVKVYVLDGTWSQAVNMNKRFPPHIPRVSIHPTMQPLFEPLRKQQKDKTRISTLEAVCELLRVFRVKELVVHRLRWNLKVLVDQLVQQSGRPFYHDSGYFTWQAPCLGAFSCLPACIVQRCFEMAESTADLRNFRNIALTCKLCLSLLQPFGLSFDPALQPLSYCIALSANRSASIGARSRARRHTYKLWEDLRARYPDIELLRDRHKNPIDITRSSSQTSNDCDASDLGEVTGQLVENA